MAPAAKNEAGKKRVMVLGCDLVRVDGSGQRTADPIPGDLKPIGDCGLGQAGAAEHANAARLRHGQAIDHGHKHKQRQAKPKEESGESHDLGLARRLRLGTAPMGIIPAPVRVTGNHCRNRDACCDGFLLAQRAAL
jgi:hypothetical protein